MSNLSRRDFLKVLGVGTAATAASLALAACSSSDEDSSTSTSSSSSSSTTESSVATQEVITENTAVSSGTKNGNVTMGEDSDVKTMVSVQSKSFETLDPFFASGAVSARQRTILWDPLWDMELGGDSEVGICAKEWTISEDGYTVDATIYDNIYDWEGNHIDASDFEWFYNQYLENKTLSNITDLAATGEYTLEIVLKHPYYAGFLRQATQNIVAVSQYAYDSDRFRDDPVGTGPYKCIDFISGAKAVFMQTYCWWGTDTVEIPSHRAANVDVVEFQVITENTQIQTALETNSIQCADITVSMAEDFEENDDIQVTKFPESYPAAFVLNCYEGSVFADNFALREAVYHALDYDSLCLASSRGTGTVTGAYGNDSLSGYNSAWETGNDSYDPDLAKEKLAEAGYSSGDLTLRYCTGVDNEVALVLQANLSAIGIGLDIDILDETQYLTIRDQPNGLEWDILYRGFVPNGFMTTMLYSMVQIDAFDFGCYCGVQDQEAFDLAYTARYSQDQADIDAAYENIMSKLYYLPSWNEYSFEGSVTGIESLVKDCSLELIAQASLFDDDYSIYYEG